MERKATVILGLVDDDSMILDESDDNDDELVIFISLYLYL